MNRRPVTSSNVSSVGWQPAEDDPSVGTLEVQFHSGHVYQYDRVPQTEHEALLGANSIGRYLNQNIIGTFDEQRIR